MKQIWDNLGKHARIGLVTGILVILAMTAAAAWWVRTEYQVLFSDLSPQDAGAMTAELERMKQPYKLADGGRTILVDKEIVHQTRIRLMSKELPLHGTLGFELFNNTDFGMTEFAQKINYQRALQGEITRTILSLNEIQSARVHLALPEEGLFKRASSVPKASITLLLKQGEKLRAEQINGIQRLVAAAVPGIAQSDVTIIDQHGVALTRASHGEGEEGSTRLELKKEMEAYLSRKAAAVLDRTFGPGQALATVDVSLNMDQVRTTVEDVLAPPVQEGMQRAGTLVKERETVREGGAPLDAKAGGNGGSSQREAEYSVGRRVENIVAAPGSVRHIEVVAVVRVPLEASQQQRVRDIVAAAVGASAERGDTVIVQPLAALAPVSTDSVPAPVDPNEGPTLSIPRTANEAQQSVPPVEWPSSIVLIVLASILFCGVSVLACILAWRRRTPVPVELTDEQRRALLLQLQGWMRESDPVGNSGSSQ